MDNEWIENLMGIMLQAVDARRPCDMAIGTVAGISPLSVRIDQKTTLAGNQLIVPRGLTDHVTGMVLPGIGEAEVTVKNALKAGEQVLLLQRRGAQQYLVLDRY